MRRDSSATSFSSTISACAILGFAAYIVLAQQAASSGEWIQGRADVIDGDTLRIASQPIRLFGIDAPEDEQNCETLDGALIRCGGFATGFLSDLIEDQNVVCRVRDRDRFDRLIARCSTGPSYSRRADISAAMVSGGWAIAYRKYSRDYIREEEEARTASNGLWQLHFENPEDWRRRQTQR